MIEYIKHFNVRIKKTVYNQLTRENYCEPTNIIMSERQKIIERAVELYENNNRQHIDTIPSIYYEMPNEIFKDMKHYTDEYVKKHYNECMKNFDMNMAFMNNLVEDEFNQELNKFLRKYKRMKEIRDLNECKLMKGIYVLVLDKYKQVYIGQSDNIKRRIMGHWSRRKEFEKLIFGEVDKSILSIDSFGALDTTRIFVYKTKNTYDIERKMVDVIDNKYVLNRTRGGIGLNQYTYKMELILGRKSRNLDDI